MLNPKFGEYVVDTASGSCGFTVHSIFWVWGEKLTAQGPNDWQKEYASTHVYGLDFDARAVKIAQALNLIAGDGRTNVYRANTLASYLWDDKVQVGFEFTIYRGMEYVGKVVINRVERDYCSGESKKEIQKSPIQVGDQATTRF